MYEQIEPTVLASGFQSPEGPSFNRQGVLHVVDWDAQTISRVTLDGTVSPFVHTAGMPTGTKFHRNGHLFVADGDRGILDISPEGVIRVAASEWQGQRFRGPNDLVFASNGDLYFTDPRGSDAEHPIGNVFLLRRDGRVERFAGGFQFPNGIVLSDDGHTLYLAETFPKHILAFELDENGYERSRRVFATLEGGLGPDGMAFGQDGNLYVAHYGKGVVAVIDPAGEVIAELPAGGMEPTNVAFWESSLYVTEVEKGQIVRLEVGVKGQTLYGLSSTTCSIPCPLATSGSLTLGMAVEPLCPLHTGQTYHPSTLCFAPGARGSTMRADSVMGRFCGLRAELQGVPAGKRRGWSATSALPPRDPHLRGRRRVDRHGRV